MCGATIAQSVVMVSKFSRVRSVSGISISRADWIAIRSWTFPNESNPISVSTESAATSSSLWSRESADATSRMKSGVGGVIAQSLLTARDLWHQQLAAIVSRMWVGHLEGSMP